MGKILVFLLIAACFLPTTGRGATTEIRDTEIENAVRAMVRPLAAAAEMPAIKIRILSDGDFNAFVAGGEDVFINTGLLGQIGAPSDLQAVLAHEIGHAKLGHVVQLSSKIRAETNRSLVMQALGIGLLAVNPMAATGVMIGAGGLAVQGMMAFTRDEERAADDYAADLLERAGIDPAALLNVFERMRNMRDQTRANPNSVSHPLTDERIRNIKLRLEKRETRGKRQETGGDYELKMIQAKLAGYLDPAGRVKTMYPSSDKSDAALYARAIARMRGGDLASAKTGTLTLISRHRDNPYFYELLGDIEFQYGRYDDSIEAYEKSLGELRQNKEQIELALALALAERKKDGDLARAAGLAKRTLLSEPMPLAYWVLAKSDAGRSDYYLAEYYYLTKDLPRAKGHAKAAVRKLPADSPEYLKAADILDM